MSKILFSTDSPITCSGVGNQVKHICLELIHQGHEVVVMAVVNQPTPPPPVNYEFPTGEKVHIIYTRSFDDMSLIHTIINKEKPNCLVLFTDPHRYHNIWLNEGYIRNALPIYFITVWDTYLSPHDNGKQHFNRAIYEACDGIGCISKQTEWFVNNTFNKKYNDDRDLIPKPTIRYVGHGSNPDVYKPLMPEQYKVVRDKIFHNKDIDFAVLMINRNQLRKKMADLLEAWTIFYESLPDDKAKKCALILHTEAVSNYGFNLFELTASMTPNHGIHLSLGKETEDVLNQLYNIADLTVNIANAEGFGLCTSESLLAGTPILVNATGGLVDQIGLQQPWTCNISKDIKELQYGNWAKALTNQRTIIGNIGQQTKPGTHYLYDQNCSIDDIAEGLKYWYDIPSKERELRGLSGRQWCIDQNLTGPDFAKAVVGGITETITNWKPVSRYHIYKI